MSPRRRAMLETCYAIANAEVVADVYAYDVDGNQILELTRAPYAGLPPDARAAGAVLLERQHERVVAWA